MKTITKLTIIIAVIGFFDVSHAQVATKPVLTNYDVGQIVDSYIAMVVQLKVPLDFSKPVNLNDAIKKRANAIVGSVQLVNKQLYTISSTSVIPTDYGFTTLQTSLFNSLMQ